MVAVVAKVGGNLKCGLRRLPYGMGQILDTIDFVSVYAVGPEVGTPLKIGFTRNIAQRHYVLQTNCAERLYFHYHAWTRGRPLAKRLERACHELLDKAHKRVLGEWFAINPEWAKKVIESVAHQQSIDLYSQESLERFCNQIGRAVTRGLGDEDGVREVIVW